MARTKAAGGRKRGRRRSRRWPVKRLVALAAVLATVWVGLLLYLYVSVTTRFDGSLWQIPSRVYSDVLTLRAGDPLSPGELQARLERSGYARTREVPARPGQFRARRGAVDVYLRGFASPAETAEPQNVQVRFLGERVRSVNEVAGGRLRRVSVEPELLATLYGPRQEERRPIPLEQVPERFVQAVLAAEDARFFGHHGLDLRGILRAAWVNLRQGRIVQGGSTITQQTVKNLYLDQRRTWWRKLRELLLAAVLDARYSKSKILEVYLNEVYLGQRGSVAICGVDAAARFYFGVPLRDLSLSESALLAGLIRSPGSYNPFVDAERALTRRDLVLQAMHRLGFIDDGAVEHARAEPLRLASGGGSVVHAPYAVDFVQAQLSEVYPRAVLNAAGLNIFTTIDTRLQAAAEAGLQRGLTRLERDVPAVRRQRGERQLQGAVLVTRHATGAILAMVGGRDYRQSQFNRAVQARRQPGSCFKPLVFAAGFEAAAVGRGNGLTPATLLEDSPLELVSGGQSWRPGNYDREFRGPVTVRRALEESLNVPTVRAGQAIGLDAIIETARRCGIDSPMQPLPSLALGTAEVTALELATAYGAFANAGVRTTPWIIRAVIDQDGRRVEGRGLEREQAVSPQTAFLISDLLLGVFERGTARLADAYGYRGVAAGKTGTTDDTRDSWFVGYNRDLLTLVWAGYDDNAKTGLTGATGALPIWVDVMRSSAAGDAPLDLDLPPDIVTRSIDVETGELAVAGCRNVFREHFVRGSEPETPCSAHRGRFKGWLRRFLGRRPRDGAPGV